MGELTLSAVTGCCPIEATIPAIFHAFITAQTPMPVAGSCNTLGNGGDMTYFGYLNGDGRTARICILHVPFEVNIEKLEDKIKLLVGVHDV
jgi:hypothetical protein